MNSINRNLKLNKKARHINVWRATVFMKIELTKEQEKDLGKLWFIYGNNGEKSNFSQHKFIQWILERGRYLPDVFYTAGAVRMAKTVDPKSNYGKYKLTAECKEAVDNILFKT